MPMEEVAVVDGEPVDMQGANMPMQGTPPDPMPGNGNPSVVLVQHQQELTVAVPAAGGDIVVPASMLQQAAPNQKRLLDGFLILAVGGFSLPDNAVSIRVSGYHLAEVSDDLRFFANLDVLDLSDNELNYKEALDHVFIAPRLTKLLLACNGIASLAW